METTQLLILAGGKGTRLKDETIHLPKVLVKIFDNKTILDLLIARYAVYFSDVVILAGYLSERISEHVRLYYRDQYPHVRVLVEDVPMGTAGPLLMHKNELADTFLIMNGDTWLSANPLKMGFRNKFTTRAQIAVTKVENAGRYGSVTSDSYGQVLDFVEKDPTGNNMPGFINAGWCLAGKSIIDEIHSLPCSLEQDIFPKLLGELSLESIELEGSFIDIGIPSTLAYARKNEDFFLK